MKKFIKNAILIMLVICFALNIVNLIGQIYYHYILVIPSVIETAETVRNQTITGEEGYQLLASVYYAGYGDKIEIQAFIIGISIVLGIIIGMVVTFEEKSKVRVLLIYILGLFLTSLIPTIYNVLCYMNFEDVIEDFIYNFEISWMWYTLIFFAIYAIKIYFNSKKTKELNKILSEKQKQVN